MRRPSTVTVVALAAAAACTLALTASAAPTGNAPPCTPKITKIGGHKAAINCGPATATLRIGGKSYTFRNGYCQTSKSAGSYPALNLGTDVLGGGKNNAGQPSFSMLIVAHLHSPYGSGSVFHADKGGKRILGDSLIKVSSSSPAKGTFTGTDYSAGTKFTGSWDCHGVVFKGP